MLFGELGHQFRSLKSIRGVAFLTESPFVYLQINY